MNQKVKIGSGGIITLTDKNYKASGGEGSIYCASGKAYKLYHDPVHTQFPLKKLQELSVITNPQVIIPQELIYHPNTGQSLGYTTRFIDNVEPLLKYFTRSFKTDNNIDFKMINELVKQMQLTVADVHAAQCLIVDLNELNVLVEIKGNQIIPWFIDTDSYSTPSFKATAIMNSVMDRKASTTDKNGKLHYNPTIESDWFSFAVLAFWLYSNIHPYRGGHPNYKPRDKVKQMDDGISIFHPGVRVPPSVNDFKVIPPRHLDWFKRVFVNGERDIPPIADSSIPLLVPTQIITIQGTDKISVDEVVAYGDDILSVCPIMGIYYVATKTHIYANKKEIGTHKAKHINLCSASDGTIILAQRDTTSKVIFRDLTKSDPVGTAISKDIFVRNNAFYTVTQGKLIENSFRGFGNKIIHNMNEIENVSNISSVMYNGCIIQDLLGKFYLTLPYKLGSCFSKYISQLDGYRIIDAKSDKNIIMIIGEKKGIYDKFIIIYDKTYTKYDIRKIDDVTVNTLNFAVASNGLCLSLEDDKLELFVNPNQVQVIDNPPFTSDMPLFNTSDGFFFINDNSFHSIKNK